MKSLLSAVVFAVVAAWCFNAGAQAWPAKPVRLIVPVLPGQGADIISRLIAERLSSALGQPVFVDNRPGAGTMIGAEAAAKSAPDGYTFFAGGSANLAINPHLYKNIAYDPLRDFTPVTQFVSIEFVMAVNPSVQARSVIDLVKLAKERPDEVTYGSPGNGTTAHIAMATFASVTGTRLRHVPYKGSAPALTDLVAGRITMMIDTIAVMKPHLAAGRLRPIAVTAAKRSPLLPDVPTLEEQGLKGFDMNTWTGLVAPAGTPEAVLERMNTATVQALRAPEVRQRIKDLGMVPVGDSREHFGAYIRAEFEKWANAVKVSGATID